MFLQNRRCGGNTLSEIFITYGYDTFKLGTFYEEVHSFGDFLGECEIAAHDFYLGHFCYGSGNKVPNDVSYFTNIRDPVERLLSLYRSEGKGEPKVRDWLMRQWETDNGMTKRWAGIGPHGNLVLAHGTGKIIGDVNSFTVTEEIFEIAKNNFSNNITFCFSQHNLIESIILFEEQFSFPPMFSLDQFYHNTSSTRFGRSLEAPVVEEL